MIFGRFLVHSVVIAIYLTHENEVAGYCNSQSLASILDGHRVAYLQHSIESRSCTAIY